MKNKKRDERETYEIVDALGKEKMANWRRRTLRKKAPIKSTHVRGHHNLS